MIKKTIYSIIIIFTFAILALSFTACSNEGITNKETGNTSVIEDGPDKDSNAESDSEEVSENESGEDNLTEEDIDLTFSAGCENVYYYVNGKRSTAIITSNIPGTTYASSDNSIATVSFDGIITAKGNGNATITAMTPGGQTDSVTIHVFTEVKDSKSFNEIYDNLDGNYVLTADISLPYADANAWDTVFSGILDGDGYSIDNSSRLFREVNGGTIKNLKITGAYNVWGGAIADTFTSGLIEDVVVTAIVCETRSYGDTTWNARKAGAMLNLANGGTIKDCVVIMTIPSDIAISSGYNVADVAAFYSDGDGAEMINCTAYYTNNRTKDALNSFVCADVTAVNLNLPAFYPEDTYNLPAGANFYVSSATDVAMVSSDGLVTIIAPGKAIVAAFYENYVLEFSFFVLEKQGVSTFEELKAISGVEGKHFVLQNDLDIAMGESVVIPTLASTLDLNGYTITYKSINADGQRIQCASLIGELSETGVICNGKINAENVWADLYTGNRSLVIASGAGYVRNMEINAAVYGVIAYNTGFVTLLSADAKYENAVINVSNTHVWAMSDQGMNAGIGIFEFGNADTTTISTAIEMKNVIIISNNVNLGAWQSWGRQQVTMANIPVCENSAMYGTMAEFTAAQTDGNVEIDVTKFDANYWTVDTTTGIPALK